jgi:cell wall-associated NlpC family hydrolase
MSKGFIEGADLLSRWNGQMADALRNNKLAQDAVKQLAKAETLAADQIGQGILSILGVIGAAIGGGGLLAKFKSMFKGGKGAPTAATAAEATANTGKVVIDPVTGAASHSYSPGTAAAQAGSKAGIAGKALGPLAIFFMGKELIKESDPRYEMDETQSLLSALLGNQYVRKNDTSAPQNNPNYELDKTQGFLDKLLHGKRFVISGSDKGSTGLGLDASVSGSSTSPSNAVSTNSVIGIAMSQQGTPYSWGGGSIAGPTVGMGSGRDTVGFDCSSFTRYVMGKVGVVLPRTAREQQQVGTQINPKDAQPGDLLFWGMPAHHVAIYIGNDMMIEAPSTGDVVKRTGVNLSSVTSCSRVLNNKTGTTGINNILHAAGGYSAGGNYGIGSGSEPSQQLSINDLRGSSPKEAMSGGTASSSGLGLGDSSSPYGSYSSSSVNKQYLTINQQSGKLESNDNSSGTVINYGGVTVEVNVPKGASLSPQELSKAIKEELKTLPISVKVARS